MGLEHELQVAKCDLASYAEEVIKTKINHKEPEFSDPESEPGFNPAEIPVTTTTPILTTRMF